MKVAAVQMNAVFADVQANLEKVRRLVERAALAGAKLVVLPEFYTSAIAFSEKMFDVVWQNRSAAEKVKRMSERYGVAIGGSTLQFDGKDVYNVFQLVFPDGQVYSHRKDIPTQFENCYYTKGDTASLFHTPIGTIGVALCWEMLRYDTVRRLSGKSDVVLAGSCWWDLPDDATPERESLRRYNQQLAVETPRAFSRLLKVPVVHGSHCGEAEVFDFPDARKIQNRHFVGAAQITDEKGDIVARRSFDRGEGFVVADLQIASKAIPEEITTDEYWIPDLPDEYLSAWEKNNPIGEDYYKNVSLPEYRRLFGGMQN